MLGVEWWIRLHGFISLEIDRNFASMSVDHQLFYDDEIDALLRESDH